MWRPKIHLSIRFMLSMVYTECTYAQTIKRFLIIKCIGSICSVLVIKINQLPFKLCTAKKPRDCTCYFYALFCTKSYLIYFVTFFTSKIFPPLWTFYVNLELCLKSLATFFTFFTVTLSELNMFCNFQFQF